MPKGGYTPELQALLEGQPALARPLVDVLDIKSAAIKNSEADFLGEDGGLAGLDLLDGGGIRLAPSAGDVIGVGDLTGGPDITLDNAPRGDGRAVLLLACSDAVAQQPIFQIRARMTNAGGGSAATAAYARLYRLASISTGGAPGEEAWGLEALSGVISSSSPPTPSAVNEELLFNHAGAGMLPGAVPTSDGPDDFAHFGLQARPTYIVFFWAQIGNGNPALAADWLTWNVGGQQVDPTAGSPSTAAGRDLDTYTGLGDIYVPDLGARASGIPSAILAGATYAAADAIWTTNPADLGVGFPLVGTSLAVSVNSSVEGDSTVRTYIRADGTTTWFECRDGDEIGVDNTPDGFDLSGVARVQIYDLRADLAPSTDSVNSPVLYSFGVLELDAIFVDEEVEVESYECAFDPLTGQSEVPSASVIFRRDGLKDFRSFGEDLVSDKAFAALTLRLYLGHPSIPKSSWLVIEDLLVRNMDTSGQGVALDLAGTLLAVLEDFPPPGQRDLDFPFTATLGDAWQSFHSALNIPDRYVGTGPSTAASLLSVDRVIASGEAIPAIDLRQQIDALAGGVTISNQGTWNFVPLYPAISTGIVIGIDDYEVAGFDYGTDKRSTEVVVQYPDFAAPGEWLEKTYNSPDAILEAMGTYAGGVRQVIGEPFRLWFPSNSDADAVAIPDEIGPRIVNTYGAGVPQLRIRTATPRPQLQLGDRLSIEAEVYLFNDPFTGNPIRGRAFYQAVVSGVHNVFGRELTLLLEPPFQSVAQLSEPDSVGVLGLSNTAIVTYAGSDFRVARWPEDFVDETGMGGNVSKVRARWDFIGGGTLLCTADQAGTYQAVLPVPMVQDVKIFEAFMSVRIPVGTLTANLVRHPSDGSPDVVLATHVFTDEAARTLDLVVLPTPELADGDDTYTVEVEATLAASDEFEIYAYALKIREILS